MRSFLILLISTISEIANDTLKKDDGKGFRRWSRTSLTMFFSFIWCIVFASYWGLKAVDHYIFFGMLCTALGVKVVDAATILMTLKGKK